MDRRAEIAPPSGPRRLLTKRDYERGSSGLAMQLNHLLPVFVKWKRRPFEEHARTAQKAG